MGKTQAQEGIEAPGSFTDVVFLSDKMDLPLAIRRLFRHKKLTYRLLPLIGYHTLHDRPDLVGTVVIDAEGMNVSENPELGRIMECLERDNIGTILLTQPVGRPVRKLLHASSNHTQPSNTSHDPIALDDLWAQISMNLAYRRKPNAGIAVKPSIMAGSSERLPGSKTAGQPEATGSLMDSLTDQLRLAGLVQRDFLPSHLPHCNEAQWSVTFLPAEWVSGDIYDIARIDEQHIGFYLADAVGHSMPAALLTIFIKQALMMRETIGNTYRIFAPAEVMKNLNLKMVGQGLSGYQFATCCYCLLNIRTRQLTFARAGHPYPILFHRGRPPQQLQSRGALLGVFDNAEFIQQTVPLEAGDRVLLYSDGAESLIGSTTTSERFQFTEELLAVQDAPMAEIVDRLTELAKTRHLSPAEADDLTLVGLEIR
ncbi:MAG: serine/threonine-protein phosphatase [Sedimentisphaerales bacterium]|nr:serine/threonine-protein phosphatase [Sedimentisphaerales bacterium]